MATLSYDPKKFVTTWNAILFQGEMDGEFFTVEYEEDLVMLHVGAKGTTTYIENNNLKATVTYTLAQSSPTNDLLSAALKKKGPFLAKDLNGTTLISGADVRITKPPALTRGKELTGLQWSFIIPNATIFIGGSLS